MISTVALDQHASQTSLPEQQQCKCLEYAQRYLKEILINYMIFYDMSLGMFRKGFRIDMGRYENILLRTFAVKYGWRMKEKEKRECRREERGEERRQASISRR